MHDKNIKRKSPETYQNEDRGDLRDFSGVKRAHGLNLETPKDGLQRETGALVLGFLERVMACVKRKRRLQRGYIYFCM